MQFQQSGILRTPHPGGVWALSCIPEHFHDDAGHFVTGGCDGRLRTWRLHPVTQNQPNAINVSNEYENDNTINEEEVGSCIRTFSKHSMPVVSVSTSRDKDVAISTSLDGTMKVWSTLSDASDPKLVQNTAAHDVWTAVISHDGERALSGGANGTMMIIDCTVCMVDHVYNITDRRMYGKEDDGNITRKNGSMILSLAFSDDSTSAVVGTAGGSLFEIDVETGKTLSALSFGKHGGPVRSVGYISGEKKSFLSASDDGLVNIYDLNSGGITATFRGHEGMVFSAESCPGNGCLIASGGSDCRVKIWDRSVHSPVFSSSFHSSAVWGVSWVRGGDRIISVSDDGNIAIINCMSANAEQL